MSEWEKEALYNKKKPQQLILFKRYIDDINIIRSGDRESLTDLCFDLNTNSKNMKFTREVSEEKKSIFWIC